MYVKTGTYTGDGTATHAITGVGFQPRIVLVKEDNQAALTPVRIEGQPSDESRFMTGTNGATLNRIKSLDADGFTVGSGAEANANGVLFQYLAIGGEGSDFAYGSYAGNATDNRDITVGFQPDLVIILTGGERTTWRSSDFSGDNSMNFDIAQAANKIQAFGATTFQVGTDSQVNGTSTTYYWVAFKKQAGVFNTLIYTGNGSDDRDITGAGFQPTFGYTQRSVTNASGILRNSVLHSGDESITISASAADATNKIQSFISDGFQVGTDTSVNNNTTVYYAFVFKDKAATTDTLVTPGVVNLTTSLFAPAIGLGVVPGALALITATFISAVGYGVVPATLALVTEGFPPILPIITGTLALVITTYDPGVNGNPTPGLLPLVITTYAPTLQASIIPGTANLVMTLYVPYIIPPDYQAIPGTLALTTQGYQIFVFDYSRQDYYAPWYQITASVVPCNIDQEDQAVRIVLPAATDYIIPMVVQELRGNYLVPQLLSAAQALEFTAYETDPDDPYLEKTLVDGIVRLEGSALVGYIQVSIEPADTTGHAGTSNWQLMYTDSAGAVRQAGRGQLILT